MGYTVNIETVMQLAQTSYEVAERYAEVTAKLPRTDDAADHLKDQYGDATVADRDILAMLEEFDGFLKTTVSRYYLTAEQLTESAETYVNEEGEQKDVYDRYLDDFDDHGVGEYDLGWDAEKVADDTSRPDDATTAQPDGFGTEESPAKDDEAAKEYLEELDEEKGD